MPKKNKKEEPLKILTNASGIKDILKGDTLRFLSGLVLLLIAVFMTLAFISYISTGAEDQSMLESVASNSSSTPIQHSVTETQNYAGTMGARTAYYFMNDCFGLSAFFIPLFLIFVAMKLMRAYKINLWRKFINYAFLMIWFSVAITYFVPDSLLDEFPFPPGGKHGLNICGYLTSIIGKPGLFFIILGTAIFYLIYLSKRTIIIIRHLMHPKEYINIKKKLGQDASPSAAENTDEAPHEYNESKPVVIDLSDKVETTPEEAQPKEDEEKVEEEHANEKTTGAKKPTFEVKAGDKEEKARGKLALDNPYDPKLDLEFYKYPSLGLLKKYTDQSPSIDMKEQNGNKNQITNILHTFGVEISSIKATVGPTITLYEITPAQGVRISKIRNLEDDIALSLRALGIRIIAPIPGKGTIGIEVPNAKPCIVSIESILNSKTFQETTYSLPIALGKTITNEVFMVDLAKMPHLLVAGATGQGKSVGLNAIITSLLYKKHPSELKFVLIDPKKVEFSIYAPLENYFLAKIADDESDPIITDVTKVVKTLKSLCQEMDDRYLLLKKAHVRNVKEYNRKFIQRQLNPENGHRYLPYIVVIIDEFGDLIMTAGKEVELPIARIAQLARAIGIHMVIATQRPTTNIITGTIKANFPARMAFKVMSSIDSRTILDMTGANQLIGKGDMLFLAGSTTPERVQCAFIDTPEVEQINDFISKQQGFTHAYELPDVVMDTPDSGGSSDMSDGGDKLDPLFEDAARLIIVHQQGSTSLIQRKFAIGYNRAGRLMDQMEKAGIVGPAQGSKPRDVLCSDESDLQIKLSNIQSNNNL